MWEAIGGVLLGIVGGLFLVALYVVAQLFCLGLAKSIGATDEDIAQAIATSDDNDPLSF